MFWCFWEECFLHAWLSFHKPAQRYRERETSVGKSKLLREGGAARRVLNVDMAKQNSNSLDSTTWSLVRYDLLQMTSFLKALFLIIVWGGGQ